MLAGATEAPATPDVLAQVLARRAAGERIILPQVAPVPAERARWRAGGLAAAVAVVCAIGITVLVSPRADAASSNLRFFPERPVTGAEIEVVYEPGALFSGLDTLVLRGRMRSPRDVIYNRGPRQYRVATLVRARDGAFHGSVRLPDSVVFAVFAVEDRAGSVIDHNRNRLWELEVHDATGKPLYTSLSQRFNDLFGRNWDGTLETAKRLTELHPDHPGSWATLDYMELQVTEPARRDSVRNAHRDRFDAFHARLSGRAGLPRDVVRAMESYALDKDRRAARQFWMERLNREHPADWKAAFWRQDVAARAAGEGEDWAEYLEAIEKIWREISPAFEPGHDILFNNALVYSHLARDADALWRWTERTLRYGRPSEEKVVNVLSRATDYPALRPRVIGLLRQYLTNWSVQPGDATRPLTTTREQYRREIARASSIAWAMLGNALVGEGDTVAGRAALERAATAGWEARAFVLAAQGRLALGDTLGMLHEFARLAADPGFESYADSARAHGGRFYDPVAWTAWRADAAERMRRETLADASYRPLRRGAHVADAQGGMHDLRELTSGRVTIVAYWSPWSIRALHDLEELNRWAAERGIGLIALTNRRPGPELDTALREAGSTFSTYYDARGEARDVLNQTSYPEYWILDGAGRIAFEHTRLANVRRQVVAMLDEKAEGS